MRNFKEVMLSVSSRAYAMPAASGWQERHFYAWHREASPVVSLVKALARYAEQHCRRYDSPLADDPIMGQAWLDALKATRELLGGELGALDAGTCDATIVAVGSMAGFSPEVFE